MSNKRQKRADHFMFSGHVGTAAFALALVLKFVMGRVEGQLFLWGGLLLVGFIMLCAVMYAIAYMFFRRDTDEFTLSLWHTATTSAFFAGIATLLFGGFLEAFYENIFFDRATYEVLRQEQTTQGWALRLMLSAFFIGFQIKRIRG